MIDKNHEFRGGQVFKQDSFRCYRCKLISAGCDVWVVDGIPIWNAHDHLNGPGASLYHDINGEFHFTTDKLREFFKDWTYVGKFCELYDLRQVGENKLEKFVESLPVVDISEMFD